MAIWPQSCPVIWTCCNGNCNQTNSVDVEECQNEKCKHTKCAQCKASTIVTEHLTLPLKPCFFEPKMLSPPNDLWICCECGTTNLIELSPRSCPICAHARCGNCPPSASNNVGKVGLRSMPMVSFPTILLRGFP
ncbi:uncharacterized protein BDR25DRAFT_62794 [Lindgomyces ingoldianus]|uniref:Uncharacterized protein n=1 Tax=Lindgomyces ingoldianus TaxID=673940 RepID=A0ACB6QKD1_9PLEO|nr:uncharacterized protein BDR25DRAFT_62794 [Lindgomyces ingoldianus]KAF2467474.1 hypothetical protein BDR25DRAFT_62794 [Lindgomyces ingoldianus]